MPFSNQILPYVKRSPAATALVTITLAAGAIFTVFSATNSETNVKQIKTSDGRVTLRMTSSGSVTQSGRLVVQMPTIARGFIDPVLPPYTSFDIARFIGNNSGSFVGTITQNNATVNATTDVVAQNSAASDFASYIDMGFTSQTYSVLGGAAQAIGPSEGYLFTPSSDISIGTQKSGKAIKFWVPNQDVNTSFQMLVPKTAEVMSITNSGVIIGQYGTNHNLFMSGSLVIGKALDPKTKPRFANGIDVKGAMSGAQLTINNQGTGSGKVVISGSAGSFICMRSPSGAWWVLTISNAGATAVTGGNGMCP